MELNRLESSSRDAQLRKALIQRAEAGTPTWEQRLARPCRWWSRSIEAEHRAWLELELEPVRWEETTWHRMWHAGQPVIVTEDDGFEHTMFVRLFGATFERWCRGDGRRLAFSELTTRDPRLLWEDSWVLQMGLAVTSSDPEDNWIGEPGEDEPELAALLEDARSELRRPPLASTLGLIRDADADAPAPARTAWTLRQRMAMARLAQDCVEPAVRAEG